MTDADAIDPLSYAHRLLDPVSVLKELGFKPGGTDENDVEFWIKQLNPREVVVVNVDNKTATVSYRKVRLYQANNLKGKFRVLKSAFDVPAHELRKLLTRREETLQDRPNVDNLDATSYALTTANVNSGLADLGFQLQGVNKAHESDPREIWHKNLGRGVRAIVVTSAKTPTRLNFFKYRIKGRGVFADHELLDQKEDISVNDLRRIVMHWHTEALDVVHHLLDASPDAFDPRADLERLIPHQCPECGSRNISTEADDEGLLDCFNCGIWFDPLHPDNSPVINQDRGEARMEAIDPDDPAAFLHSLPPHPEAAGMKQPKDSANYWHYLFESKEGHRCRLAVSHSLPEYPLGSYTISLDVGGYYRRQMQETVTIFWQSQSELRDAEMRSRESIQRFIQAVKTRRPNVQTLERLWKKLFVPLNQGPRPARESIEDEIRDLKAYAMQHGMPPRITCSYSCTTPESAEQGDFSETGWHDKEGQDMRPDEFDEEEGITVADKAAKFLYDNGATEGSSSAFHPGVWYSTGFNTIDYTTGEEEERSYHLVGFTEEQEREVWHKLRALRRQR